MKFSATQDETASALQQVIRIIQPQNVMAIASGVQLEAQDGQLRLSATDLSHHSLATIPCEVMEPGYVVLPASTFNDFISRLPTATFTLSTQPESGQATLRYGRNTVVINGFGREMLPEFPQISPAHSATITLPAGTLTTLSRELLFACGKDDYRPMLKGVFVQVRNGQLVMVATDGNRLSHAWQAMPGYREMEQSVILPSKMLAEGARINAAEPVTMRLGTDLVELSTAHLIVTGRLLAGQYPDYDRVIPDEYVTRCRIPVAEFRGAVDRISLIVAQDRSTPLQIHVESGLLILSAEAAKIGRAEEVLECPTEGDPIDIQFNPAYIGEAVKSLDSDDCIFEFSGIQSAARFRSLDDSSYFHVLLPLRQLV
jgi:DNA polymerase-3 subunit beta